MANPAAVEIVLGNVSFPLAADEFLYCANSQALANLLGFPTFLR